MKSIKTNNPKALKKHTLVIIFIYIFACLFIQKTWANEYIYKAKAGDSLWNISKKHLIDMKYWSQLIALNKLPDPNNIAEDTIIRIPIQWLHQENGSAKLIYTTGDVQIIFHDASKVSFSNAKKVTQGLEVTLLEGSIIKTGKDALATIIFLDGSRLLVQSNSELKLEGLDVLGDGTLSDMNLYLDKGSITNDVNPNKEYNIRYEIHTKLATTSVRGTKFTVSVGQDDLPTIAEVLRGKIVVKSNKTDIENDVTKGRGAIISEDGEVQIHNLPKAPFLGGIPPIIERSPINIVLPEVQNIKGYHTVIIIKDDDQYRHVSNETIHKSNIISRDIPDGNYTMIVAAINDKNLKGEEARYDFILKARPIPPIIISPQIEKPVSTKDIQFKWAKQTSISAYRLEIAQDFKFDKLILQKDISGSSSFLLQERPKSGTYFWRIAAISVKDGQGPFSDPISFKILPHALKLDEAKYKDNTLTLRWNNAGDNFKYRFQISQERSFKNILLGRIVTKNFTEIKNLLSGTYYFRLQIISEDGFEGIWGQPQTFTITSGSFKDYLLLPLKFLRE
ncbi:hypothetical protein AwWohl_10090 [Gammaproteobacteria bacterium]|nr:hypothetical protein AwWohl_10090 [Gammaproteobacteria bacterium]